MMEAQNAPSGGSLWTKVFLFVALAASFLGAAIAAGTLAKLNGQIKEAREAAKPANISVVKITAPDCADCLSVDAAVTALKGQNVTITEERALAYDSTEGQELIKKLGITKVPTYVVRGELKKLEAFTIANGEMREDQFVFTKLTPVYLDPATKKAVGRVSVISLVDSSCKQCFDLKSTIASYKNGGIRITEEKELAWDSPAGQELVKKYKIEKLPTFILSADADAYPTIKDAWARAGTVEADGSYVARAIPPPYRDLKQKKIVGLVDVIYLSDATCKECYKPQEMHKPILANSFGVALGSEQSLDVASKAGQALVAKYKIIKAPTILLSPDAKAYASLVSVWPQVGTIEADGWYVFRQMEVLESVYKDLASKKIIDPKQASVSTTASASTDR